VGDWLMSNLIMMVGCPASGKSTVAKNFATSSTYGGLYISRDVIRFSMVKEDEEYFSRENEVYAEFIRQIKDALDFNAEVFADATHLNETSRAKTLRALGESIKDVEVNVIWVRVPVEIALSQNENRIGTRSYVPKSVIRRMHSQITRPTKEEGFDHIYIFENGREKEIE
jgi:predicted kinase